MKKYTQFTIYLSDDLVNELKTIIEFRNTRILLDDEDKKIRSIEEFIKGSVIRVVKWLKSEEISAGLDDLGKPFRLKNRFKEIATSKGINGKMLAEMTSIQPSNISVIFSNKSQASLDYFLRIWIALGCPPLKDCLYREEDFED